MSSEYAPLPVADESATDKKSLFDDWTVCDYITSVVIVLATITFTVYVGYKVHGTSTSTMLLMTAMAFNVVYMAYIWFFWRLSVGKSDGFKGITETLHKLYKKKPQWQIGGFVAFSGVGALGVLLFINNVVVSHDVLAGSQLLDPKTCDPSVHCYLATPSFMHKPVTNFTELPHILHTRWQVDHDRYEFFRREVMELMKSDVPYGLSNVPGGLHDLASLLQHYSMPCWTGPGPPGWFMSFFPSVDFTCGDVAKDRPPNLIHPLYIVNSSFNFTDSTNECQYVCTKLREFVPSDYIMAIGMIFGGGAFMTQLVESIVDLGGSTYFSRDDDHEQMKYKLYMGLLFGGRAIQVCVRRVLGMHVGDDDAPPIGRYRQPMFKFLVVVCGLSFGFYASIFYTSSLVDKTICFTLCFLSMLALMTRRKAMCTEALFKSGYDTFIELGDAPDYIPYRKEYSLFEWMQLTQLERANKLIRLARIISGKTVKKDRSVKLIADTKAQHHAEEKLKGVNDENESVDYICTCQVKENETGKVLKIIDDIAFVKFDTKPNHVLEVNAMYLIEASAAWDKLEMDVKKWFDDQTRVAKNQENDLEHPMAEMGQHQGFHKLSRLS
mmetsp:Transcript_29289/g.47155  ORF Transcript_29289/g.47155 Transcript_29289/m.47155 type:complete len:608 (+) Transcript_29289:70-1893(+)